jgi:hypothetical protein
MRSQTRAGIACEFGVAPSGKASTKGNLAAREVATDVERQGKLQNSCIYDQQKEIKCKFDL